MTVSYADPFKVYFAAATGSGGAFWSEATADTYNVLRMGLLGHDFFFTGGTMTDAVQDTYTRTQMNRGDVDWLTSDAAPLIVNIESANGITSWEPFQPHITTDAGAFTAISKAATVLDIVREVWPTRRIGWYGWTPDTDWYAVKNWNAVQADPDDANYTSRLNWYNRWKRENERVRFAGTSTSKNNRGLFTRIDFCMPWMYLPNDTEWNGSSAWYNNEDCAFWAEFFRICTAECKRLYQKPCYPMVQFFIPETTTGTSAEWIEHTLDTAYNDPNCDGVVIYHPTSGATSVWRDTVASWVTDNLGA